MPKLLSDEFPGGYSISLSRLASNPRSALLLGILPIFAIFFIYAVTWSFIWDEGFHLIAAHLIASGKRPYIDFCFPQTPLNAYINAGILLAFGNKWQPVHLVAAAYMCTAIWLVAEFVQSRLPSDKWRTPCALAAAVLFGLNLVVLQFGPAAQAYPIAMLFGVAGYRAALSAVTSRHAWFALLAGLCAGGAAGSTLLTAPLPAVLLLWLLLCNVTGSRWLKAAAFLLGCAISFSPILWLFSLGPRQTLFNVVQYQALFRRVNWGDANDHDLNALTDWLRSPQALILLGFFIAAIVFLFRENRIRENRTGWLKARREFLLAAILSVLMVLFISTAHPTFERYYVVAMPFIGIVAALGLFAAGARLASPNHAWLTCGLLITLGYCMFFRDLYDEKDDDHWSGYEEVARAVSEVTPMGANLYADELTYFLLQRDPPEGMAFSYAQKLELPPEQEKLFHIISSKKLKKQVQAGHFATLETCRETVMTDIDPAPSFKQHSEPNDCDLFWQPNAAGPIPVERKPNP